MSFYKDGASMQCMKDLYSSKKPLLFLLGIPLFILTILFVFSKQRNGKLNFWGRAIIAKQGWEQKPPRQVNYRPNPENVISLSPHFTQMVIDVGRQDALIAISEGDSHPAEVGHLPKVKYRTKSDLSALLAFRPGTILGLPSSMQLADNTTHSISSAIEVISTQNLYSFEDVFSLFRRVNMILDRNTLSADPMIQKKKDFLQSLLAQTKSLTKPTVAFLYPIFNENQEILSISVVGKGTPEQDALFFAGGQNAFSSIAGYETLSLKELQAAKPDFLVIHPSRLASLSKQAELKNWFQHNKIIAMDTSAFVSSRLDEATWQLAKSLHPQASIQNSIENQ